jgi:diguanylate cyclase (GGDEF)-like protein
VSSRGRARAIVLTLLLLALSASAPPLLAQYSPDLVQLPVEGSIGDLKPSAAVRLDPDAAFDPEELIQSDAGFERYSPELEQNAPRLWLKFRVAAPVESDGRYVLTVARRFFPEFSVYVPDEDGTLRHYSADFDERVTMDTVVRQFATGFDAPPGQVQTLLIGVDTIQDSLQPLELWLETEASFLEAKTERFLILGLFFGILLALIFHNLILYLNLRQHGHLYYVLAVSSVLLFLGLDSGLLQTHWLPEVALPHVTRLTILFSILVYLTISLFFLSFVAAQRYTPRLAWVIKAIVGLLVLEAIVVSAVPDRLLLPVAAIIQPIQLLLQVLLVVGAFMAGRRGATEGYFFLAAWLVFIVSGLARVFMTMDLVPRTTLFEYLVYLGSILEAGILGLGLNWRVRQLYLRHARALQEQHKAARLANLDPLTDAYNRRFLQTYLESVMPGPEADSFDRAVLILDLDNFKETNDEYGHAAGDVVLRELVRRCQRVLREGDVMCRLGGDEFVIVLSDQSDRSGLQVARRVIEEVASEPFLFDGAAMPVTTSIGVVSSVSPRCTVSDILRMADQALYQAKQAGRNRAVLFDPDKATPFRHGPSRAPLRLDS